MAVARRALAVLSLVTAIAARGSTMEKRYTDEDDQLPFVWWFEQQNQGTLNRCDPLTFNFGAYPTQIQPVLPLYLIATPQWGFPVTMLATNSFNQTFTWAPNYVQGTQLVIAFVDAAGNSGGTSSLYTMVNGPNTTCQSNGPGSTPLSFTISPSTAPLTCTSVGAVITGGRAPYTLTVNKIADRGVNFTSPSTNISWTNTLSAGGSFIFSVSDGDGNYATTSQIMYSQGGNNKTCLIYAPPQDNSALVPGGPHPVAIGTIVGSVLGGIAIVVVAVIAWCYMRRRKGDRRWSDFGRRSYTSSGSPEAGFAAVRRADSASSTEKLAVATSGLRSIASGSQVGGRGDSPAGDSPSEYGFSDRGGLVSGQAAALPIKGRFIEDTTEVETSGPDYYSAVTARAGEHPSDGSYRSVATSSPTTTSTGPSGSRFRVRQHQDGGSLSNPAPVPEEEVTVDLPPQYGAFSGSAALAEAADLAAMRPKGHSGLAPAPPPRRQDEQ